MVNVEELQDPGIDLRKLKTGCKIIVKTNNSTYTFETTKNPCELYAIGGLKIPSLKKIHLSGSTWGGSCIKIGWIGLNMYMEMHIGKRTITTSLVKSIRIIGEGWWYDLNED